MEETFFTIEEAAGVLVCSKRTVYRMLDEGLLKAPGGRPKKGKAGQVSKKSLFQFLIVDHISQFPKRVLKAIRKGRKKFGEIFCQNAEANRFSSVEEKDGTHRTDGTDGSSEAPVEKQKQCLHHDFAERHQFSFGWRARQLAPHDRALQDDLVQEMSLAVLEYDTLGEFRVLVRAGCESRHRLPQIRSVARPDSVERGAAFDRCDGGEGWELARVH
jgi:hypothetical protein